MTDELTGRKNRFSDLITNPKDLSLYLGCTVQAVNQYKQGVAFPKTENLIKIADYYNVSIDYLVGHSDVKSVDATVKAACDYTGLCEYTVRTIRDAKRNRELMERLILKIVGEVCE